MGIRDFHDRLSGMTRSAHPEHAAPAPHVYFDAELRPYRSLSPTGFMIVMGSVAAGGFFIGLAFFLAGAWPVAGFCGLEVLLIYGAFKLNFRSARRCEFVKLTDNGLEVRQIDPSGKEKSRHLEPSWISVDLDNPPKHESQLVIRNRAERITIGSFLLPGERAEIAASLREALAAYRAPDHLKTSPT